MSCAKGHIDIPVGQLVADEANRGTTIGVLGDLLLLFVQINKNLNKIELFFLSYTRKIYTSWHEM